MEPDQVIPGIYLPYSNIDISFIPVRPGEKSVFRPNISTRLVWKFFKNTQYQYVSGMGKIPPQKRPHNRPVWYAQKSITSPTLVTITLLTRPLANFSRGWTWQQRGKWEKNAKDTSLLWEFCPVRDAKALVLLPTSGCLGPLYTDN
jgi:hypothetical protein